MTAGHFPDSQFEVLTGRWPLRVSCRIDRKNRPEWGMDTHEAFPEITVRIVRCASIAQ